jgi:glycine/D-amino acid oxidase-like deaminating enzyme/nitrite reductase/ring-hydroxylating ferredoxin subunit
VHDENTMNQPSEGGQKPTASEAVAAIGFPRTDAAGAPELQSRVYGYPLNRSTMTQPKPDSGSTTSAWMATADVPTFPPLDGDAECDVCIVGAGIAGLTTAYTLGRAGKRVIVLDDGPIGGGETGRTTAHLSWALDDFYAEIEKVHGHDGARIAAESHRSAVDRIEAITREERIECDFERVNGYWFAAAKADEGVLDAEAAAARRAGVMDVTRVATVPGVPFHASGLRFGNQGQFHPLKYLAGLARAIVRRGGRICSGSHVAEFEARPRRPQLKTSDKHTVTADAVVFATNSPVNDWVTMHTKQAAYRTYVIAVRIPRGAVAPGLYWDTRNPYHYVRLTRNDNELLLIVGGEDHKTGQADDNERRFGLLLEWTRQHFPMAGDIAYRWSGQVIEPNDYMGFIGLNPGSENVYIATGDSGQGMTHGTIAGMLIPDLILGIENRWVKLYDPSRVTARSAVPFLRENMNVAAQYVDWLTPGEVSSPDEIRPGSGAVMRQGAKKFAVYCDEDGTPHIRSAVCPHLFCIVDWNSVEKTWDCPCHGSRFDRYGKVVNGPANSDLADPKDK